MHQYPLHTEIQVCNGTVTKCRERPNEKISAGLLSMADIEEDGEPMLDEPSGGSGSGKRFEVKKWNAVRWLKSQAKKPLLLQAIDVSVHTRISAATGIEVRNDAVAVADIVFLTIL